MTDQQRELLTRCIAALQAALAHEARRFPTLGDCPFCGCSDVAVKREGRFAFVQCHRCTAAGPRYDMNGQADDELEDVAHRWNMRHLGAVLGRPR